MLVDDDVVLGPGPDRGMVFQGHSLFPWLTVARNTAFGLELAGVPRDRRASRVTELLEIMDLAEHGGRLPRELSGGMRQRVAIARALAPEPDLLLLDEPFGALNAQTRLAMHEFLGQVWQRTGATIVLVTHDVDEAVYLSQRVYVMRARPGRIVEEVPLPFGIGLGPAVKRTRMFLDVRDEIHGPPSQRPPRARRVRLIPGRGGSSPFRTKPSVADSGPPAPGPHPRRPSGLLAP